MAVRVGNPKINPQPGSQPASWFTQFGPDLQAAGVQPPTVDTAHPVSGTSGATYVNTVPVTGPNGQTAGTSPFNERSTMNDFIEALNKANAAPGSDAQKTLSAQFKAATGATGGPGNGWEYGQVDDTRGKIYFPGGTDAKYENGTWKGHAEGPGGPATGAPAGGATLGTLGFGDLTKTYGQTYTPPAWATEILNSAPQTFSGTYTPPDWAKLGPPEQWNKEFKAPTEAEVQATPGYQFALDQGLKGVDTGAAAKGTLLTSGNQKSRLAFATGLADQTYQGAYQRALGEYQQAYQIFQGNQQNLTNRATAERGAGLNEFNANQNTFFNNQNLQRTAATNANETGLANFLANYNIWNTDNNNVFNRLNTVSGNGQQAATQITN